MQLFKTFKLVVITAGIISAVAFFFGVVISFVFALPPGAAVVLVNASIFIIFMFASLIVRRQ
jgi:zinc transport system permease protein